MLDDCVPLGVSRLKKSLIQKRPELHKLVAIVGGLLMLAGIIILGMAILAVSGFLNVGLLLDRKHLLMFALGILLLGLFDIVAAVVISRW
jgi:hydrogenase-4 membrane subunit HyfE